MSKPQPRRQDTKKTLCHVCGNRVAERHTREGVFMYQHTGPCGHSCSGGRLYDGGSEPHHGIDCPCIKSKEIEP